MLKNFLSVFVFCTSFYNLSAQEVLHVTASDYVDFLNDVSSSNVIPAEAKTNLHSLTCGNQNNINPDFLYDEKMESDVLHGCVARVGTCGSYQYFVITGRENWPITFVTEDDQIAYCSCYGFISNLLSPISNNSSGFQVMSSPTLTLSMERPATGSISTFSKFSKADGFALVACAIAGSTFMMQRAVKIFDDNNIEETRVDTRPTTRKPFTPQLSNFEARETARQIFLSEEAPRDSAAIATEDGVRKYSPPSSLATVPLSSNESCDAHKPRPKNSDDYSKSTRDELFLATAIEDLIPSITKIVRLEDKAKSLNTLLEKYNTEQRSLVVSIYSLHQKMNSLQQRIEDVKISPLAESSRDIEKKKDLLISLQQQEQIYRENYEAIFEKIDDVEDQHERVEKKIRQRENYALYQKVNKRIQIESDPTTQHLTERFLELYEKKKLEIRETTSF